MDIDRNKAFKLLIVIVATIAALAVMSTVIQIIQTLLPFLIIGGGIFWAYRWAFSDAPAPTADEVQEQARGWFGRFRRTKQAVETTVKVGATLQEMSEKADTSRQSAEKVVAGRATKARRARAARNKTAIQDKAGDDQRAAKVHQMKAAVKSESSGAIEFKDSEVIVSADDIVMPDLSRLQEKEQEESQVTDNVMSQIEERRRRLHGGG